MHRNYNQKAYGAVTAKPAQELRLDDFTRRRF